MTTNRSRKRFRYHVPAVSARRLLSKNSRINSVVCSGAAVFCALSVRTTAFKAFSAGFHWELTQVLRRLPVVAGHMSELVEAGAFLQREVNGVPVLLTRDGGHHVHAFLNVWYQR